MNIVELKRFLHSSTARLALSYLLIIMLMSIGFSWVFFHTTSRELGRQLPPRSIYERRLLTPFDVNPADNIDQFFQTRIAEGRSILLERLIALNIFALGAGSFVSYYLARRTLQPIEDAMDGQSRFVSDASHELRTPLTAIQTTNEVALRKPKLTLPEAKEIIQHNVEDVIKLKNLSESLLSLATQSEQTRPLVAVSAQEIVGEAMNRILAIAQAKHISVQDTVPDMKLLGNKEELVQVLVILLDNAVKYSHDKGTIFIAGQPKLKQGYISVKDEGAGIKAVDLPHIFDRFYRADNSRSKEQHTGYGLGLSIAKKIVEQFHGAITAESTVGSGATFTLQLPLA